MNSRLALAAGGALGAALWGAQQPLDQRVLRAGYDDIELLGTLAVGVDGPWRSRGWAIHVVNGAAFGLAYAEVARRTPHRSPWVTAMACAMVEHVALYPLAAVLDRVHPARGRIARSFGPREFVQATWRHALLGAVLGAVGTLLRSRARARA